MRWLAILLLVSIGAEAGGSERTRIETRYGIMDVSETPDTVDIRFRGRVVRSVEALGASLYRVTPHNQRDFVIVDAVTPGLHCHHFFMLVELSPDGQAMASEPFGACKEVQGVEFDGDSPLVRLAEPYIAGRDRSPESTDFAWRNGHIVPVSVKAAPKSASECAAAAETATAQQQTNRLRRADIW